VIGNRLKVLDPGRLAKTPLSEGKVHTDHVGLDARNPGNFLVEFSRFLLAHGGVKRRDRDNQDGFSPPKRKETSLKSPATALKRGAFCPTLTASPIRVSALPLNVVPPLRSISHKSLLENLIDRLIMTYFVMIVTPPTIRGRRRPTDRWFAIRWRDRSRPKTSNIWNRLGPWVRRRQTLAPDDKPRHF
jgi:hypothetical protein